MCDGGLFRSRGTRQGRIERSAPSNREGQRRGSSPRQATFGNGGGDGVGGSFMIRLSPEQESLDRRITTDGQLLVEGRVPEMFFREMIAACGLANAVEA